MAQEPDNLVLQMLRDIRATLAEHSRFHEEHRRAHAEHREAFAELRAEMQQVNQNAVYAFGLATLGQRDGETTLSRSRHWRTASGASRIGSARTAREPRQGPASERSRLSTDTARCHIAAPDSSGSSSLWKAAYDASLAA